MLSTAQPLHAFSSHESASLYVTQRREIMSKIDRIKEEIGWLKLVFGVLVAVDVSLLAWLVQNYSSANSVLLLAALLATIVLTGAIVWVNRAAYRRIEELEEL